MNKLLYRMERKFGRYALRNLSLVLILCYAVGYVLQMINPSFMNYLTLNPYLILHGQIWRLFSWILIPPGSLDFFTLIMLYFYYSIGTNLEQTWGAFRYNLYMFSGMVFTILGSFALYGITYMQYGAMIDSVGDAMFFSTGGPGSLLFVSFSTFYVNMSIFLAYAATFPDVQVLLMFIIPIKIKVLGIIYAALLVYQFLSTGTAGKVVILASLLNFIVFFLTTRNYKRISPQEVKRKQAFKRAVRTAERGANVSQAGGKSVVTRHKCAICGRTELDDGNLEFRFCSKCEGNYEYCMDHLYTHEHVHKA